MVSRRIPILQVDAFSGRPFGGNPAGVVLDADGLGIDEMKRIAGEMNAAETAFVSREATGGADFGLRWFTRTGHEVAFCGHGTVAAAHALGEAGRFPGDRVVFGTPGGLLPVALERGAAGDVIWLEPALPACSPYAGSRSGIAAALGAETLGEWGQPALTSERDLLLPMPALEALRGLAPDMVGVARAALSGNLRGTCCVALGGLEAGSRTHARFFAPHLGIPEDPVTGSVHAAIPVWLWQDGLLAGPDSVVRFTAEQGDGLGRPGRLRVELHLERRRPHRVRVGGEAVTVLSGTLRLD